MKNLLNLKGAQALSKNEQQEIHGGKAFVPCSDNSGDQCDPSLSGSDCGPTAHGSSTCPSAYTCRCPIGATVGTCNAIFA